MKKTSISFALVALAALAAGCSFNARSPEDYAKETPGRQFGHDRGGSGHRQSDAETGELTSVAVDTANTTAAEPLPSCVTSALAGLKLAPPDARDGLATYAWDFQASAAPVPVKK